MDFLTNPDSAHAFTRRLFLQRGVALASAATTIPLLLERSAEAFAAPEGLSSIPGVAEERVLVVVQLAGGNDGLNTVIPYGMDAYYRARPGIGVAQGEALALDERAGVGLHPRLAGLKALHDDGMLSVVQGVGYPNPDRSHFRSMDIWHTADTSATGAGWLGKFFDNECEGAPGQAHAGCSACAPLAGVAIGQEAPLAMQGRRTAPASFERAELLRWSAAGDERLAAAYDEIVGAGAPNGVGPDGEAAFLMRTALDARVSSEQIRRAVAASNAGVYPRSDLGGQLAMVGAMIRAELPTRVYYVSLGGFDTHAGQGGAQGRHANLLAQFGDAIRAFYSDLRAAGQDGRVLTMVFSEFGRRVGQNASGGTDHGAAAPMFLVGPMVRAGLVGAHPSLDDLDNGDLRYGVDFRRVYGTILSEWMGADQRAVLGRRYAPVKTLVRGL
ncbi:MAG: DUF1501 domain-containing protein [Phycisphaerales bacterium]